MTKAELRLLITLAFVQFTHILDSMILMPMAPTIRKMFTISTQEFGFLVSAYGISAFVSAIIGTFWVDKFDRKKILVVLYLGFLIGTLTSALSPNYYYFLASRIFTGFFGGLAGAVILSIVGDSIPFEKRGRGMGILMSGFAMASVIGIPLAIYLSESFTWQAPFLLICSLGVFVAFGIMYFIPNVDGHLKEENKRSPFALYKMVFSHWNTVMALILSFCVVCAHFAIIPFISDYFVNNLHFDLKKEIIFMYICGGLLSVVNSPFVGKMADRFGKGKVFIILSCFAVVPLYLVTHFESHSLALLIGMMALFFIFSGGRMIPSSALITSAVMPAYRGGFMSLNSALQQLAVGLCTLTGGLIITNDVDGKLVNYPMVGFIGIAFTVISILVSLKVKPVDIK